MSKQAYYFNKGWARKAMTILLDKMILFETVDERDDYPNGYPYGQAKLGIKFEDKTGLEVVIWPTWEADLENIRNLT